MIYPSNFENKIQFSEIRSLLKGYCLSQLGKDKVDVMAFGNDAELINTALRQTREFRRMQEETDDFPLQYFFDMRASIKRIRIEGTHLEENEIFDLRRSLETIAGIVKFLNRSDDDGNYDYPTLHALTENVLTFPDLIRRIDQILDKYGKIKDTASPRLAEIRSQLRKAEGSVSRTLYNILRAAQSEGLVEKDVTPTLRDGRLVVPIAPAMKRRIKGIVHDESSTGKTVFVEPTEVVEANNRIRELEADERREIIVILTEFSKLVRPHVDDIIYAYQLLAEIDFIRARAEFARLTNGIEPEVSAKPVVDWITAKHPLLWLALKKQDKPIVPLDIMLTKDRHILIISGPNAGGKSVCLKTVGLLQYMLQCGLSIPVSERSKVGIFADIMIDIGDEQSIENDLSTYSSHLLNMKNMMKQANENTLLLIDEFGTGTEPQIGGAMAEAVLNQFVKKHVWGVITTHYQNLKHYADSHDGIANGAMLYDRHEMRPLFQLAIGQPGSSFAIEIARKTGIPDEVIREASDIVGSDYIQSDKYLQDIVRDKRYWENKRQNVHQREKDLEKTIAKYEEEIKELAQKRKEILRQAKEQAQELLKESNRNIENTIREIRECQAEKEETKRLREELNAFKEDVSEIDTKSADDLIEKKMRQIMERKERREKRKKEKKENAGKPTTIGTKLPTPSALAEQQTFCVGDNVRMRGLTTVGTVEAISGKEATVIFGDVRTKVKMSRLEHTTKTPETTQPATFGISKETRQTIDSHKLNFHQDLDVRGMRGDEALNAVQHFIDDAILVGMSRVRILHGKGNGILRQLIRQYLQSVPNVTSCKDEHVQFGGAGITVVDF
ncbi:endonuclease MutS2 [Prevotella sp.]|uniref:endonuclease MutS2 n=1 Tax=Prevotella sp. TaxID=59823 RepID=UPI0027E31217|nr:Smr/MutS family protein [Prevotella sp.]